MKILRAMTAGLVISLALVAPGWALMDSDTALDAGAGVQQFGIIDCAISGEGISGTKIVFPETRSGDYLVEVDRGGRTLTSNGRATGYAHAHDGESYRGYFQGQLILTGVGVGECEGEATTTTTPDATTTTQPGDTTTTTTLGDTTTTTQPAPTTTIPGEGGAQGCPPDQHPIGEHDGRVLCAADVEGG